MEITPSEDPVTLEEVLSTDCLRTLQELEIKDCRGQLVEKKENPIVEFSDFPFMEILTIDNCQLEAVPRFLLSKTKILKSLLLPGNKIIEIKQKELEPVKHSASLFLLSTFLNCEN